MTIALWTGVVPVDAIDTIEARVDRLRKRAERVGFPVPTALHGSRSFRSNDGVSTEWMNLVIEADGPLQIGDFEFVGTISALGDGSPFITYAPGVERTDYAPDRVNYCDHCHTLRDRNNTYIVRSDGDAALFQVGSSCIKDYTGHDPALIVAWLRAVNDLSFSDEEVEGWGRSATRFYDVSTIIDYAARIVSKTGYISKQKSEEEGRVSTAESIRAWLSAGTTVEREFNIAYPVDEASERLFNDTMVAVGSSLGTSDWALDIARLVNAGSVQWRHVGILGSAVILGMRKVEREAAEGVPESHFIGTIGQHLEFSDVLVTLVRGYENMYGQGYVIRMRVNGCDDLLWFSSGAAGESINEGDTIRLVGTVKGHEVDSRSHRETTVLTRCKVKE